MLFSCFCEQFNQYKCLLLSLRPTLLKFKLSLLFNTSVSFISNSVSPPHFIHLMLRCEKLGKAP